MGLVPLVALPASAAPPDNDEVAGAVAVNLGDRVEQDTTEATTNAGDEALNEFCEAPFTNASVWYSFTPTTDRALVIDASESNYGTGLMVFKGTPTADSLRTCGPGAVGLRAKAGKTYYIMVFSDNEVNGGSMVLSLTNAPKPSAHVAISKRGVAYHPGAAKIHGTFRCKHGESFAVVEAHLLQRAGRLKIQADSGVGVRCNGHRHRWSVRLVSPTATYARGPAVAKVRIIVCGLIQCTQDRAERHVRLAWAPSPQRQQTTLRPTKLAPRPHATVGLSKMWPGR
jgi:hypothetical protein